MHVDMYACRKGDQACCNVTPARPVMGVPSWFQVLLRQESAIDMGGQQDNLKAGVLELTSQIRLHKLWHQTS